MVYGITIPSFQYSLFVEQIAWQNGAKTVYDIAVVVTWSYRFGIYRVHCYRGHCSIHAQKSIVQQ